MRLLLPVRDVQRFFLYRTSVFGVTKGTWDECEILRAELLLLPMLHHSIGHPYPRPMYVGAMRAAGGNHCKH